MIKTTIDYVQAVKWHIFWCDEFCDALSKSLKSVDAGYNAPTADEIKNKLQEMYDSCEGWVIRCLEELKEDNISDNDKLIDYSESANIKNLNLEIIIFVNEKTKELVDLKVVFKNSEPELLRSRSKG